MFKHILNYFKPKNAEHAAVIKFRLSVAYAILGWNAFILMFYRVINRDLPTDPDERRNVMISKLSPVKDIKIMRVDGLTVVEERSISAAELQEEVRSKQSTQE
ncbi:uncharacterized protein LOC105663742 [Megachile rotundata]|uniref:uncharacterized protein LOC105663742 n=1 Tax=Megachile rotundata TaxID=143995 RepID=UPI000614AC70|nr:PREDICTED: uncharacterized protein LOC105663742 [Megachile rotundata]